MMRFVLWWCCPVSCAGGGDGVTRGRYRGGVFMAKPNSLWCALNVGEDIRGKDLSRCRPDTCSLSRFLPDSFFLFVPLYCEP